MKSPACAACHEADAAYGSPLCEACMTDEQYQAACCVTCGDSVGCSNLTSRGQCVSCRPMSAEQSYDDVTDRAFARGMERAS